MVPLFLYLIIQLVFTIAKLPKITNNNTTPNFFKTITVANQTEVPILHFVTLTLNTTIDDNSRHFIFPFAVVDIKYNILGAPFSVEKIQNFNIQDFTLQSKHRSKDFPNHTKFTSLVSKDYPYISYIHRINSKTQLRLKPNSFKLLVFYEKKTTITFILLQHQTINSFLQYLIILFIQRFVPHSIFSKLLQMTDPIHVLL